MYRLAALTGVVISVGGLTESLVRQARSSILNFLAKMDVDGVASIVSCLIALFAMETDRVILPLLNTLGLLLENSSLDATLTERPELALELIRLTKTAIAGSNDVKKIIVGVEVLCGFVQLQVPECRIKALTVVVSYLCHKFPRVRKATAEKAYLAVMAADIPPGKSHILSSFS